MLLHNTKYIVICCQKKSSSIIGLLKTVIYRMRILSLTGTIILASIVVVIIIVHLTDAAFVHTTTLIRRSNFGTVQSTKLLPSDFISLLKVSKNPQLVLLYAKKKKTTETSSDDDNDNDDTINNSNNNKDNSNNDTWESMNTELIEESIRGIDGINPDDTDDDWVPDTVKAQKRRKQQRKIPVEKKKVVVVPENESTTIIDPMERANSKRSPYTDEEEELIQAMGGRTKNGVGVTTNNRRRQEGYLGDCTLQEIGMDYSVPVSYLADVLCMWGVPIPINVQDRLGDLVTGEQAFAIVEAVNTLDVATLHDRYSNTNLLQLCSEYDIEIQDAFSFCIQEGYNLPFGVQTCLRVEQEDELLRVLGAKNNYIQRDYEYSDDDDDY